jgi:transcriptional regulator with XRE-family HTH domain
VVGVQQPLCNGLKRRIPLKETRTGVYIGIGLKRLKEERGWTQEKLAEESNLNTRYLQDLLYNEKSPSLNTVHSIAEAFGMKHWEFLKSIEEEIVYKEEEKKK